LPDYRWLLLIAFVVIVLVIARHVGVALGKQDPEYDPPWYALSPLFYIIRQMMRRRR
jgi:hypothetical protein